MIIRTARYYNVPPWELAEMPSYYLEWGAIAQNAENRAHNAAQERANTASGGGSATPP